MMKSWIQALVCWLRLDALSPLGWAEVSIIRGRFQSANGACERDGMKEVCIQCGRTRIVGYGTWRLKRTGTGSR